LKNTKNPPSNGVGAPLGRFLATYKFIKVIQYEFDRAETLIFIIHNIHDFSSISAKFPYNNNDYFLMYHENEIEEGFII